MAHRSGGPVDEVRSSEPIARRAVARRLAGRFHHRLTVVCGPAGIGKSTVIELTRDDRDVVVGCSVLDRSPERLLTRVLHALGHDPRGAVDRLSLLERVAEAMLVRAPSDVCLVLDDVHRVSAQDVISDLLAVLPMNGHLLVSTRTPLQIPLGRLDAAAGLLEVGIDELRFSDEEVREYAAANEIAVDDLDGLDGWPALLALAHRDGRRRIRRYVTEELVTALDASARRALASITVLGPVSAADIEALIGWDAEVLLRGLPLVTHHPLDGWRLHDLWSELLDGVLTDSERRALVERAAAHWRANGETDRAIDLAAEHGAAAAFTSTLRLELIHPSRPLDARRLATWIDSTPPSAVDDPVVVFSRGLLAREHDPTGVGCQQLLVDAADGFRSIGDTEAEIEALAHSGHPAYLRGDFSHLADLVRRAQELVADGHSGLESWLTLADALAALLAGDNGAVLELVRAVPTDAITAPWRGVCSFLEARSLLALGHASAALEAAGAIDEIAVPGSTVVAATARWASGEPHRALAAMSATAAEARLVSQRDRFLLACNLATMRAYAGDGDGARTVLADAARCIGTRASRIERIRFEHTDLIVRSILEGTIDACGELARFMRENADDHPGAEIVAHHLAWHLVNEPTGIEAWHARATGPVHVEALRVAELVCSARAGRIDRSSWPPPGAIAAHLPGGVAAELAVAGMAVDHPSAPALAAWLSEHWGPPARAALVDHAAAEDSGRARVLLRRVPAPPASTFHLSVLGPVELRVGDQLSTSPEWQRSRVRELAAYLAVRRQARREEIADALWPHLDAAAGAQNLRRTLAYLNTVLEPERSAGDAAWFVRVDAASLVLHDSMQVDIWAVDEALARARHAERQGNASAMTSALRDAIGRWRGPFAGGSIDHEWADEVGRSYTVELCRAATRLAELSLAAGDARGALDAARIALRIDPWDGSATLLAARAEEQLAPR